MELPILLRQAVDQALEGVALADLMRAAANLSERYRGETRDGRLHLSDDLSAKAYLATRLPATYAAIRATMAELAERRPDFAPESLLDVGAGPGTVLWAASDCWPGLHTAHLIEGSGAIRRWGEALAKVGPVADITWQSRDIARGVTGDSRPDLVSLAYVLSELSPEARARLIDDLWALQLQPANVLGQLAVALGQHRHLVACHNSCPHSSKLARAPTQWWRRVVGQIVVKSIVRQPE